MESNALNILHVEDDPLYASLMEAVLDDDSAYAHYNVVNVDSLKKALLELKNKGYGAVLLDLTLPDASGLDNVRAIKQQNPDLPIIVLSGVDNEKMAMKAIDEGAQDYIIKGYANDKMVRMAIQSSIKRKIVERELYQRAHYDALTGLMNRSFFMGQLQQALNIAKHANVYKTVLFIDLDGFKAINDTHGHEAGNAVLQEVANRMKNVLQESDIVARYGGDEFMVLLADDSQLASAHVVSKLQNSFNAPLLWQDVHLKFAASIGVSIYPEAGEDAATLLENADKAMYEAKKHGCSASLSRANS